MFGQFNGILDIEEGNPIEIHSAIGWAEDYHTRWKDFYPEKIFITDNTKRDQSTSVN